MTLDAGTSGLIPKRNLIKFSTLHSPFWLFIRKMLKLNGHPVTSETSTLYAVIGCASKWFILTHTHTPNPPPPHAPPHPNTHPPHTNTPKDTHTKSKVGESEVCYSQPIPPSLLPFCRRHTWRLATTCTICRSPPLCTAFGRHVAQSSPLSDVVKPLFLLSASFPFSFNHAFYNLQSAERLRTEPLSLLNRYIKVQLYIIKVFNFNSFVNQIAC